MGSPLPKNEEERLRILQALKIMDTGADPVFEDLCRRAAQAYNAPIALISLVDRDRQWFKAEIGLGCTETGRDISFCSHAILADEPLIVPDASLDARFMRNPLVVGEPRIRFYAGAPLFYGENIRLGTLCIIDTEPRAREDVDLGLLRDLADRVSGELWVHQDSLENDYAKEEAQLAS